MDGFSLTCSYCDRPAFSFKPGTAPRVEFEIILNPGERGEILCHEHIFLQRSEAQLDLFSFFINNGE